MARKTFSIRGQVLGRDRTPGSGLTVSIERISPLTNPVGIAYLPDRTYRYFNTGGDGRYVVADTVPGRYALQVQFPGMSPLRKIVNILNSDVDVDFDAADVPTGRIILDNAVPGPQFPIAEVAARLTPPIVNLQRQPARDPK